MSKLGLLKNEYSKLCKKYEKAQDYLEFLERKLFDIENQIDEIERKQWFKYKGKTYYVCYEKLEKNHRALLFKDKKNGNYVIKIASRLNSKERQRELHIILKRKKCLKYF